MSWRSASQLYSTIHQHPTPQFFTGQMPFLPPNQQRQSTEGIACVVSKIKQCVSRLTRDVAPTPHSIVGSWEECSVHFLSAAVTTSSLHRVSHSSWLNLCLFIHGLSALWRRFEVVKRLTKMYSTTLKLSSMPSGLQYHELVFCVLIYMHTNTHFNGPYSGLPRWAGTRKEPIWILLKQETVSGIGISWAICKSAPRCRQMTMPEPHHRPDALSATQPTASKHWKHFMYR